MTKRIALLLAVAVYAASLSGCGCCRRFRGTLCPGALCGGSRAPVFGSVASPASQAYVAPPQAFVAAPQVMAAPTVVQPQMMQPQAMQPQVIQPQVVQPQMQFVQPQMMAPHCVPCQPQCVPCQPVCPCPCPCPPVCEPCCDPCCESYSGESGYAGYAGDCGCNAPFGIEVQPGEYFSGVETGGSNWEASPTPADVGQDPGPAN
jgi:hypothetical protein